jgi:aerobic-type carbon monoxide dehydrogenase small subunit (CoxS/CutS family)
MQHQVRPLLFCDIRFLSLHGLNFTVQCKATSLHDLLNLMIAHGTKVPAQCGVCSVTVDDRLGV